MTIKYQLLNGKVIQKTLTSHNFFIIYGLLVLALGKSCKSFTHGITHAPVS